MRRFRIDKAKAVEAIVFVANRLKDPDFHSVCKMLYFADLEHLEKYGRFITGDTYHAMEWGPVPTYAYDLMKEARGDTPISDLVANAFEVPGRYHVKVLRDAELGLLSKSDVECLESAVAKHGHKTFGQLADESHDQAWHATPEDSPTSLKDIVEMLPSAADLKEHFGIA